MNSIFHLIEVLIQVLYSFSQITSTAGGGTLTLEFGVLSRLTDDPSECCDLNLKCVLLS